MSLTVNALTRVFASLFNWCIDLSYNNIGEVETTIKSFSVLLWSRYIGGRFNNIMCRQRKYIEKTKTYRKNLRPKIQGWGGKQLRLAGDQRKNLDLRKMF